MTVAKTKAAKLKLYTEEPPKAAPSPIQRRGQPARGAALVCPRHRLVAQLRPRRRGGIVCQRENGPELVRPGQPGRRNYSRTSQARATRCGVFRSGAVGGRRSEVGQPPPASGYPGRRRRGATGSASAAPRPRFARARPRAGLRPGGHGGRTVPDAARPLAARGRAWPPASPWCPMPRRPATWPPACRPCSAAAPRRSTARRPHSICSTTPPAS